jgi:hypothetical protein
MSHHNFFLYIKTSSSFFFLNTVLHLDHILWCFDHPHKFSGELWYTRSGTRHFPGVIELDHLLACWMARLHRVSRTKASKQDEGTEG